MATNNAHSDLIHLFIDGEATETERKILFDALKDSPELQEELTTSMQLKQAFASDIAKLQPPSYLESQIAERAGLIVAASASVAGAPVLTTAVSNAVSNIAPVATGIFSKGAITLLVGTSVGILSTIGIIKLSTSNNTPTINTAPATVNQRVVSTDQKPGSLITADTPAEMKAPEASYVMQSANSLSSENLHLATKLTHATTADARVAIANAKEPVKQVGVKNSNSDADQQKIPVATNDPSVAQSTDNSASALSPISIATPKYPGVQVKNMIGTDREALHLNSMYENGMSGIGRFSARLSGIAASKLFQGKDDLGVTAWQNAELAVKYDLDASLALGVEAGNEKFPVYTLNGNGGYKNHQSISWFGASASYSAVFVPLPLNIHPEFRMLGAYSTAGPIVKFSGGLAVAVTARLTFSTDVEETMLFIKSNGANITGNKLAVTAGLTWHF